MSQLHIPEKMDSFFNARAPGYEEHMKESDTYYADKIQFAEQFDVTNEYIKILDLGCGTGLEIEYILQRTPNAKFLCIDLAENMLELLKSKYKDVLNQIEIIKASYFDYDFGCSQYDYVVASATMHHWLHNQKLLLYKKIYDSLKPGGKFINDDYIVPEDKEKEALEKYVQLRDSGVINDGEFYHVDIPFSVKTERKIFYDAGFQKVKIVYEHYSEKHCGALLVGFKMLQEEYQKNYIAMGVGKTITLEDLK
jgi:tRNA (cmo5U34)-methyltransferase